MKNFVLQEKKPFITLSIIFCMLIVAFFMVFVSLNEYTAQAKQSFQNEVGNFAELQELINGAKSSIILSKDYEANEGEKPIEIGKSKTITIDLNGHKIDGKKKTGTIFYLNENFNITIEDSQDNKGVITGGIGYVDTEEYVCGGAFYVNRTKESLGEDCDITINGGTFTKNDATIDTAEKNNGYGGVICNNYGHVTITGGVFTDNTALDAGIIGNLGGTVNISGGKFTNNKVQINGGVIDTLSSDVTISGGEFTNNQCTGIQNKASGGVILNNESEVKIIGGTFTNNFVAQTAISRGGCESNFDSSPIIGGSVIMTNNKVGEKTNNLEIEEDNDHLILDEEAPLEKNSNIGISIHHYINLPYTLIESGATEDTLNHIHPDNSNLKFVLNGDKVIVEEKAKFDAKAELDKAAEGSLSKLVMSEVEKGKTAIDSATTIPEINEAKETALSRIKDSKVAVDKAIQEINDEMGTNPSEAVKIAGQEAIDAINNAESLEEVEKAKENGLAKIRMIKEEEAKEQESATESADNTPLTGDNNILFVLALGCLLTFAGSLCIEKIRKRHN